ncbi:MAG: DUF1538 domain-containing protein [Treponema sp.]
MNVLTEKFKEVLFSVLPISILIIILNALFVHAEFGFLLQFICGVCFICLGLTIFLFGIDIGITPIGDLMGQTITARNKISIVLIGGIILGFFISIAEPDLQILGSQVMEVTKGTISQQWLVIIVSIGVAVFLSVGLFSIVYHVQQPTIFILSYLLILVLSFFSVSEGISIAFDSSGATTGAITVPFILAIAAGVSRMKKDSLASETDSFGLVGMVSAGAIISVLFITLVKKLPAFDDAFVPNMQSASEHIGTVIAYALRHAASESALSLLPIAAIFLTVNTFSLHLKKSTLTVIIKGLIITFIGLTLFLAGVKAGFLDFGFIIGSKIGATANTPLILLIGAFIGCVVILAEPAVYVLTKQIENVSSGHIPRKLVLIFLAIGVSTAAMLSMLRIITPAFQLWHILLPGYFIALMLTKIVPSLFVGIAFDAGGVASGPMTATFVLSFAQGVASATPTANVLIDGFGIIAAVALAPVISLQILGLIVYLKQRIRKDYD